MTNTGSNSAALEDLRKEACGLVKKFGEQAAAGEDALPKLALKVIAWAEAGTFGENDAKLLYDTYTDTQSKKAVHSEGGKSANTSKLRQLLKMGSMTTIDPVKVMDRAVVLHQEMRAAKIKVKSAYAAYVDVAKAQIAAPAADLNDDELKAVMSRGEKEKSAETCLKAAQKALEEALTYDMEADEREAASEAFNYVGRALTELVTREETQAKRAKILELQEELRKSGQMDIEEYLAA